MAGESMLRRRRQLLVTERNGYPRETYYTFSFGPIPDDDGSIGGNRCANTDDTDKTIAARRLALLGAMSLRAPGMPPLRG